MDLGLNHTNITTVGYTQVDVIAVVFEAVLTSFICFSNSLIFAAFVRNDRLRTIANYYILQLALTDFGVGLCMPLFIVLQLTSMKQNIHWCMMCFTAVMFFMCSSVMSLLAITWDRFTAITQPLTYHEKLTIKKYIQIVVGVWFIPVVGGVIIPSMWHNSLDDIPFEVEPKVCDFSSMMKKELLGYISIPWFAAAALVLVGFYARIFQVAKQHLQEIAQRNSIFSDRNEIKFKGEIRMVRTGATILGAFFLCWAPYIVVLAIQIYGDQAYSTTLIKARKFCLFPAVLNSALNPVIYAYNMVEFKQEFMKILGLRKNNAVEN